MKAIILLVLFIALILITSVVQGQTIPIKHLDHFIGKFAYHDPDTRDSVDVSQFVEWIIDTTTNRPFETAQKISFNDRNHYWVFLDTKDQFGAVYRRSYRGFGGNIFYILSCLYGFCGYGDILSVWGKSGDSLSFKCAQSGIFNNGSNVKRAAIFPDSSYLLFVESNFADGGEAWGGYTFYRGETPCNFKRFYSKSWTSFTPQEVHFDIRHLFTEYYKVSQITEFFSFDSTILVGPNAEPKPILDSAIVDIIDLWEIAIDSFDIDILKSDK